MTFKAKLICLTSSLMLAAFLRGSLAPEETPADAINLLPTARTRLAETQRELADKAGTNAGLRTTSVSLSPSESDRHLLLKHLHITK